MLQQTITIKYSNTILQLTIGVNYHNELLILALYALILKNQRQTAMTLLENSISNVLFI